MTRTYPPNPNDGPTRPPLTDAEHQALVEHLTTVTSAARIAVIALADGRAVVGPRFPALLADLEAEIAAARRILHGSDDTAALAINGTDVVTDDDVKASEAAYALHPDATDGCTIAGPMRAALETFVPRFVERLPELGPAATEPKPWRGTCGQIGHPGACQCDGTTDVTCTPCAHPAGGHYGIGGCTAIGPDGEPCCDCQRAGADIRMAGQ